MAAAIYISILGFALGVLFETFSNANLFFLVFILVTGLAITAAVYTFEREPNRERGKCGSFERVSRSEAHKRETATLPALISLFLIFFFLGALRYETYSKTPDPILSSAKGKIEITGFISEDPDVRQDKQLLTFRAESVGGQKVSGENNILIEAGLFPKRSYGDELAVYGPLVSPRNFSDDTTGETFDYVSYLQKDRIYFVMYQPQMNIIAAGGGNPIMAALLSVKHAFADSVDRGMSEPNSSLVNAIILGERHSVPQNILDMLRTVGIIHIVILSGYAITIVAESVRRFFSRFGFRTSIILASVSIILFALMTGATAMVVRASIMALFAFLSRALSRKHDVVRALALTVFLMVLWNPMILVFDVSFQVSILAVAGLVFISPIFEKKFINISDRFGFKSILISTLSAQIAVVPYLLYVTGSFSLYSVPANILVLVVLPMTMFFGLLSGVFGFVSPILAFPFSAMAYFLTSYELFVARIFSSIPFSSILIPLPFWAVLLIYLLAALKLFSMTSQFRLAKKSST